MDYIARSQMKVQGLDGVLRTVEPGEALPEFAGWEFCLREAHLDQGTVEQVGGQETANLDFSGGYISMGPKTPAPSRDVDVALRVGTQAVVEPVMKPAMETRGIACTICGKYFSRPVRLKAHLDKHHS